MPGVPGKGLSLGTDLGSSVADSPREPAEAATQCGTDLPQESVVLSSRSHSCLRAHMYMHTALLVTGAGSDLIWSRSAVIRPLDG